jgi:sec-independent protein translocase protein TatB
VPISGNELLVLLVLAAFLIGPERLPEYAEQVARLVRRLRDVTTGARARIKAELGPEFEDVDWSQFDPRRYDPRRIVREALLDEGPAPYRPGPSMPPAGGREAPGSGPAPFDDEAT